MGVFLSFRIAPHRITAAQWKSTYQEALQIVKHCDLMDRIFTQHNGERFVFARKTAERDFEGEGPGILICGTMTSGCNMEDFRLFRNLEHNFHSNSIEDNGADILFDDWYPEDSEIPQPSGTYELWGNKTQGEAGHIPLLAIACLFADRFPEAVKVGGDITAGQCRAAVRLANQYLERPIQVPVTCRAEALARHLQNAGIPTTKQLDAFFRLYLGALTPTVGVVLSDFFSSDALYRYFRSELAHYKQEEYGFQDVLRDYLLLAPDFSAVLQMLVSDSEGSCLSLEQALTVLFSHRIHVPLAEKNCNDPLGELSTVMDGDVEMPHEINATLGRFFFSMIAGRNWNLPVYVPLDTIRDTCRSFGSNTDILIDRLLVEHPADERQEKAYGKGNSSIISMLHQMGKALYEERQAYDIKDVADLVFYHSGCTVYPVLWKELLSGIKKIQSFDIELDYQAFLALDRTGRETNLICRNHWTLIHEDVWDYIFAHITDDAYIRRYFFLLQVDCSAKDIYDLMESLLSNPLLIDELWEAASENADQKS